jgi:hypothetical protein
LLTRRPDVGLLGSILPLDRFSLSLIRTLALLRLGLSQPVGCGSPLHTRAASLIVVRIAMLPTIVSAAVVKPATPHFLIARRVSDLTTRIPTASHHTEPPSASESSTVTSAASPEMVPILLIMMRRDLWSCPCHHHLGRMLKRSLIVAGLIVAAASSIALVERVIIAAIP